MIQTPVRTLEHLQRIAKQKGASLVRDKYTYLKEEQNRADVQRELEEEAAAMRAASSGSAQGSNSRDYDTHSATRAVEDVQSNGSYSARGSSHGSRPGTATSRRSESSYNSARWSDPSEWEPPDYEGETITSTWAFNIRNELKSVRSSMQFEVLGAGGMDKPGQVKADDAADKDDDGGGGRGGKKKRSKKKKKTKVQLESLETTAATLLSMRPGYVPPVVEEAYDGDAATFRTSEAPTLVNGSLNPNKCVGALPLLTLQDTFFPSTAPPSPNVKRQRLIHM